MLQAAYLSSALLHRSYNSLLNNSLQLLPAQREIIDRSQQRTIEKNPGACAQHELARCKRAVSQRQPRSKIVGIAKYRFVLVTQALAQQQLRHDLPLVLHEEPRVQILLR